MLQERTHKPGGRRVVVVTAEADSTEEGGPHVCEQVITCQKCELYAATQKFRVTSIAMHRIFTRRDKERVS